MPLSRLDYLDVPGFVAHPERVLLRVADIQVTEIDQTLEFIGFGKFFAEVAMAKPLLAHVKVTHRMV